MTTQVHGGFWFFRSTFDGEFGCSVSCVRTQWVSYALHSLRSGQNVSYCTSNSYEGTPDGLEHLLRASYPGKKGKEGQAKMYKIIFGILWVSHRNNALFVDVIGMRSTQTYVYIRFHYIRYKAKKLTYYGSAT